MLSVKLCEETINNERNSSSSYKSIEHGKEVKIVSLLLLVTKPG